ERLAGERTRRARGARLLDRDERQQVIDERAVPLEPVDDRLRDDVAESLDLRNLAGAGRADLRERAVSLGERARRGLAEVGDAERTQQHIEGHRLRLRDFADDLLRV